MLIVTVYHDEITTVSTPNGDVISFVVKYNEGSQAVIGVDAPDEYVILRAQLRERLINQIKDYPVYIVSSDSQRRYAISARTETQAIHYYQQCQPSSRDIQARWVKHPDDEPWFEQLISAWMLQAEPPIRVSLM